MGTFQHLLADFNTSHVSINHTGTLWQGKRSRNFNTSHVSINLCISVRNCILNKISIHLMFLLIIAKCLPANCMCLDFNTSHVSINLVLLLYCYTQGRNFNTSHVSINPNRQSLSPWWTKNFNTSHVSINHNGENGVVILLEFQYISCFY